MAPQAESPLEVRIGEILAQLRPYLETDGIDCRLVRIDNGIAFIALGGKFVGCASLLMTVRMGIEKRLMEELPDTIHRVEIAEGETARPA
ncbi:MAG: hypothetical protein PWP23_2288 [Candidatus Sumerlaeota bacterium]|nr:hypothetical protein [Candidatus Sumerlaeota bacterium]